MKRTLTLLWLLAMLMPCMVFGQKKSEKKENGEQYKVAACDWMMLKRQKLGAFKLSYEIGADGLELDMGGLGKRDTFDNKLRQEVNHKIFQDEAAKYDIEVASMAMSGFFAQSFLTKATYRELIIDCLRSMEVMGAKVAFLPFGGIQEDWRVAGPARDELVRRLHVAGELAAEQGKVIGIRTALPAKENLKLLKEVDSKGIKIYYNLQDAIDNGWDVYKDIKKLGKKNIAQIHASLTDSVTLDQDPRIDMYKVKETLDKMKWSGWLVVERSRNARETRNVKKNYGTNVAYLKKIFQGEK